MKASVFKHYGPPEVVQVQEVEKPSPKDREILIKVHATTVTPTDCAFRKGDPFIIRVMNGIRKPRTPILGGTLAGVVETVGRAVTAFQPGDQVFGASNTDFGTHAEYKCLPEDGLLVIKPAQMTFEEAAGLPEALTPLYFFRELAHLQPGQNVLINGASGTVGTFAVQLAKYLGADVTGVCSTTNLDMVKSLGADAVIDYTREDFTRNGQTYDVIFDAVAKRSFSSCRGSLKQGGVYLTTVPSLAILLQMLWTSKVGSKKAIVGFAGFNLKQENLHFIKGLTDAGKLKSVVDRCYPLEAIVEAYRYVETGHKKGNVVIVVAH